MQCIVGSLYAAYTAALQNGFKMMRVIAKLEITVWHCPGKIYILENKKFFELKSEGYRDGIKRKETR